MDSELFSEKTEELFNDTGQNASVTVPGHTSPGEESISQENQGQTVVCSDINVENCPLTSPVKRPERTSSPSEAVALSPVTQGGNELNLVDNLSDMDIVRSRRVEDDCEVVKSIESSFKCKEELCVKPKIIILSEDQETRSVGSGDDEDMDPLLAVDDTESQSSDLINFDTVSYDVIHQFGVDEEEDDEKSIATVSSLSCDIKIDSPQKLSLASNSSSLVNLLDSSLKETSGLDRSLSPQMLVGGSGSVGSSCPSSPSPHSSKTKSSATDESVSESVSNLLVEQDETSTHAELLSEEIPLPDRMQPADPSPTDVRNPTLDNDELTPVPSDQEARVKDQDNVPLILKSADSLDGIPVFHDNQTAFTEEGSSCKHSVGVSATKTVSTSCTDEASSDVRPKECVINNFSKPNMTDLSEISSIEGACVSQTCLNASIVDNKSICSDVICDSEQSNQLCATSTNSFYELVKIESKIPKTITSLSPPKGHELLNYSDNSKFDDSEKVQGNDIFVSLVSPTKVVPNSCESSDEKYVPTSAEMPVEKDKNDLMLLHYDPISVAPLSVTDELVPSCVNVEILPNVKMEEVAAEISAAVSIEESDADASLSSMDNVHSHPSIQDGFLVSTTEPQLSNEENVKEISAVTSHEGELVPACINLEILPTVTMEEVAADISAAVSHEDSDVDASLSSMDKVDSHPSIQDEVLVSASEPLLCNPENVEEISVVTSHEGENVPACINLEILPTVTMEEVAADISAAVSHEDSDGDASLSSMDKVDSHPSIQDKVLVSASEPQLSNEEYVKEIAVVTSHDGELVPACISFQILPTVTMEEVAAHISAAVSHEDSDADASLSSMDEVDSHPSNQDNVVVPAFAPEMSGEENLVNGEMNSDVVGESPNSSQLCNVEEDKDKVPASAPQCLSEESVPLIKAFLPAREEDSVTKDTKDKIPIHFEFSVEETTDTSQSVRTPSPVDSAPSVSDCTISEYSVHIKSSESCNDVTELCSIATEVVNGTVEMLSPDEVYLNHKDGYGSPVQDSTSADEMHQMHLHSKFIVKESEAVDISLVNQVSSKEVVTELEDNGGSDKTSKDYSSVCRSVLLNSLNCEEKFSDIEHSSKFEQNCATVRKSESDISNPEINVFKKSTKKCQSVDLSEFWGISDNFDQCSDKFSDETKSELHKDVKQYNVAILDEAQQTASYIVDDVLQKAILKAEEKLRGLHKLSDYDVESVSVTHTQVFEVNEVKDENLVSYERKDSGCHSLSYPSRLEETMNQEADESTINLEEKCDSKVEQDKSLSEPHQEETFVSCRSISNDVGQNYVDENTSELTNISEGNSLSEPLDSGDKKEQDSTISLPDDSSDLSRGSENSLLIESDLEFHSQAGQLVDSIIDLAVQKCEESLSTSASPSKPKSLFLDDDFSQEEEELATPCGEMLTEHFMDFESGRNVSVFCSIPESGSQDHLLAYDRIVNTIGNREVDSDTGKSVSVFRSEEEVFYEIQRASTCTSVFESVEEEDEDMIDTTVPLENRSDTMQASAKLHISESTDIADDNLIKDCDAFEDAVDAFLSKERLARDDLKSSTGLVEDTINLVDNVPLVGKPDDGEDASCKLICIKHPEYDLSNQEEKKRMAEKWANGGESEVPDTPEMRAKQKAIREALDSEDDVAAKLCKLALTEGGLINDTLRREAWPRMLGLDPTLKIDAPSLEDLKSHPEYEQVVLDVNRSLKRFPPDIPKDQWETLQDKLTRLIMYVISKHPHLRYYQGYHDVAVTFLLVVGESIAFQIMERLSTEHLSDCMQPTMERTSYLLLFIYPLIHRLHPALADYLERSEVGTMFCLPWFLTWFGHSLDRYQDVVRLYDHFLASPPLAPLYLASVLVAHRADEVLAVDCDMAAIHALLSHIPDTLPLEILLRDATDLYDRFPPESIEREVEERFRNEQLGVQRQRALRRRRGNNNSQGSGSWQLVEFQDRLGPALNRWIPPWVVQQQRLSMRLLFASATFFVGFYVYSRGGDMLPYP